MATVTPLKQLQKKRIEQLCYGQPSLHISSDTMPLEPNDLETFRTSIFLLRLSGLSPCGPWLVKVFAVLCHTIVTDFTLLKTYSNSFTSSSTVTVSVMDIYSAILEDIFVQHLKRRTSGNSVESLPTPWSRLQRFIVHLEFAWCCKLLMRVVNDLSDKDKPYPGTLSEAGPHLWKGHLNLCKNGILPDSFHTDLRKQLPALLWDCQKLWLTEDIETLVSGTMILTDINDEPKQRKYILTGGLRLVAVSGALLEYTNNDQQMVTLALSLVRDYLSSINEVCRDSNRSANQYTACYSVIGTSSFIHQRLHKCFQLSENDALKSGFLSLLHQAAKICDDTVEVATKQQITNFVCFLSHDPESNDWKNPRPFYEGERCSFSIQMLNYQLRSFTHDLKVYIPYQIAARMIAMVMSNVTEFLFQRYSAHFPTRQRIKQFSADVFMILSIVSTYLPYLAPLTYDPDHYLAVYMDKIHFVCSKLLSLLMVVSCPLQSIHDMLQVHVSENETYSHQIWLHYFRKSGGDHVLNACYSPPHSLHRHRVSDENIVHFALALDVNAPKAVQLILSNDCFLSKLILCSPSVSQEVANAILSILRVCYHIPTALPTVLQYYLRVRQPPTEYSLSFIMDKTVLGPWISSCLQPISDLALSYGEGISCVLNSEQPQAVGKKGIFVDNLTKELKKGVQSFHRPLIFAIQKISELCGCKVNGVIVYVISEGFKAKSATLEQDLRSAFDEFMSALCTSLNGTALLNEEHEFEECNHCEEVVNEDSFFITDELEDMCSHHLHLIAEVVRENLDSIRAAVHKDLFTEHVLQLNMPCALSKPTENAPMFDPVTSSQALPNSYVIDFDTVMSIEHQLKAPDMMQYILHSTSREEIVKWIKQRFEFQEESVLSEDCVSVVQAINSLLRTVQ